MNSRTHLEIDKEMDEAREGRAASPISGPDEARGSRKRSAVALAFCILLAAFYFKPLLSLVMYAIGTSLHSHVILIPLISAYLINLDRSKRAAFGRPSFLFGALFAAVAVAALLILQKFLGQASLNDRLALITFSFLSFLYAGAFLFIGRKGVVAAAFPLAFLLFMIPLPDAAAEWLETGSMLASAEAAAVLFGLTATPVLRDGLLFQLPGILIEVAQECSGIRSSWVLFITSLLASHLFLRTTWRRAVLLAFVIPLGIIRNGFRILVIALLCVHMGPQMIDSIVHRRGGPVFFVLSLVPLFLLMTWLRWSERRALAKRNGKPPAAEFAA